ncbi:MAG: LytTR family DNA-binding domain-containing protein [Bacteroidia bacterium]|nr:LytTR family DNA-binding domain-containing protein [Bacteroidia bacterium]
MIRILIIEDEAAAANRLMKLVRELEPEAVLEGPVETVEAAIVRLQAHPAPDLILTDIQLADGSSFEIFKEVTVPSPVIFTTAYDQYAVQAFKLNSVDYLLKPIKAAELSAAISKFRQRHVAGTQEPAFDIQQLLAAIKPRTDYQKRILIRYGQHLKAIEISEAAYFYLESKITLLRTRDGKEYPVDHSLEDLEQMLDPTLFFRINRKFIIQYQAIDQMFTWTKSRVKLTLHPACKEETIVSAERSAAFKVWLTGRG